jgi:Mitochondrial carrier protein
MTSPHSLQDGASSSRSASFESTLRRFLSGSFSGTFTAAILQPFDVIRTTQQSNLESNRRSVSHGPVFFARQIVQEQGTLALWKGLEATLLRVFFGAGIYFVTLDKVSKAVQVSFVRASFFLVVCKV